MAGKPLRAASSSWRDCLAHGRAKRKQLRDRESVRAGNEPLNVAADDFLQHHVRVFLLDFPLEKSFLHRYTTRLKCSDR